MKNIFYFFVLAVVSNNNINAQNFLGSVEVSAGWNLIGSVVTGTIIDVITTDPPGIIVGNWYGYNNGYYVATSLETAKGYWVKVSQNGTIKFWSYTTCGTVSYAGKIYNTVVIGTQCWLKENLDYGMMIQGNQDQTNNAVVEKYCYGDVPANCTTYGGLYQWDEAMQYVIPGTQGICPPNWHIPTYTEFEILQTAVLYDGNALKAVGQGTGGGAGTDISGFSALLAGYRYYITGAFSNLSINGYFWSTEWTGPTEAAYLGLNGNNSIINLDMFGEWDDGYSVRCLKD